ncbi:MAG: LuxR C-terminal-related transcriptional regulator [Chloroflexota bacterium]
MAEKPESQGKIIRIVLADDQVVARVGIRQVLETAPEMQVVGEAEDAGQVQALVAALRPDVLLLDLVMAVRSAYEVEAWVRQNYPETVVLILTGNHPDRFLAQAVHQGVQGYLTKDQAGDQLVEALRRAMDGACLITEEQLERAECWTREIGQTWEALSERERQVLRLMARGLENRVIAEHLVIGLKTVEFHIKRIFAKLGVRSRSQAISWLFTHLPEEVYVDDSAESS